MFKEFTLTSITGRLLTGNSWLTEKEEVKGNVVIAHGMAEYSMRYADFAAFLNENGYNVYMLDHIGHGKNAYRGLGVWTRHGFDKCVANFNILVKSLKDDPHPTYIMGHSMGSFIVQSFIEIYSYPHVKKVILCGSSGPQAAFKLAPIIGKIHLIGKNGFKPSKFLNSLSFSTYLKRIKNPRTPFDWLSVNEENVDKYIADPLCGFVCSRYFYVSFFENLAKLHTKNNLAAIAKDKPILLIAGKEDPVGEWGKGVEKLDELYKANGLDSTMILYDNMRHEILNEKENFKVYSDVLDFLGK